jgi:tetratricopeptide (TPR) repeat protein
MAILIGGGLGAGGLWVYYTYFPPPDYLLTKAEDKYQQAEEKLQANQTANAEKLYKEANAYLVKLENDGKDANNPKAYLLKSKVLYRLSTLAAKTDQGTAGSESVKLAYEHNNALLETLRHDPENGEAAGILFTKCMADDDLDKAEFYAEAVAKYKPEEGKDFGDMATRVAAAHYILGKAALRGPSPRPDIALEHLRQIEETLPQAKDEPRRWRELALEAQALKMSLDLAKKRETAPAKPAPGKAPVEDKRAEELQRKIVAGVERAKADLAHTENTADGVKATLPTLNPTNMRGVLDFLLLSIETATTKAELQERANLLLQVCDQLTDVKAPREATTRAVAAHLAQLPTAVDKPAAERKVPALRLLAADWKPMEDRMRKIVQGLPAGANLDPDAYLELARKAHKDNRWKDAEEMAKKGLELAANNKKYAGTAALHGEATWALFMQGKMQAAEPHLAAMRKERGLARTANFIDGLSAVREGRLETGIKNLVTAQQDPRYARSPLVFMGLARAYEGTGQTERALTMLRKLENAYKNADQLNDEERVLAADFLPDADSVNFEIFRSLLKLNQIEEALKYKEKLDKRAAGLAARILLINYYVNQGREALAQSNLLDARDAFASARQELKIAQVTYPNEPALVWADIVLIGSQPDMSRPFGLQASAGAPKTGLTALEQAERKLHDYVEKKNDFESHLLWVRWLESQGRYDDTDAALAKMAEAFPDHAKQIESLKARLALVRSRSSEAAKLVDVLRGKPSDSAGDVLQVLYLTAQGEPSAKSQTLNTVLGKHESNVLSYLWRGQLAQQAGKYAEAAYAYGRALPPSRYQAEAQVGLLTSLLALADKDSPKEAAKVIDELRRDNSIDPVVLLAYAEMSRRLDSIQGRDGMEGGLRLLERVLASQKQQNAAVAADFLARGYYAAGRADLARTEAARALQIDPSYAPALALSARLAAEAEDWDACLANAEELERSLYGTPAARAEADRGPAPHSVLDRTQPTMTEANAWRAVALEHLGRTEEAKRVYQELVKRHPKLSTGYLGLATMREHAKDMPGALEYVRQWRGQNPTDRRGLAAEVRLLVKAGKVDEANKSAEQFVADSMKAKDADEHAALLTVARAFASARAYDQAEEWGRKAVAAADKKGKDAVIAAQMVVGNACLARAMAEQGDARKADVDKAIAAYQAVWTLVPGHRGAGIRMAYLRAKERKEGDAAYQTAQDARKGRYSQKMLGGDRLSVDELESLSEVYRASKHAPEATMLLREAAKRYPQEPKVYYQLGLAYRDQRMVRDAVLTLNQAQLSAQQKADAAKDPDQKARWQAMADEARTEREKLEVKPAGKPQ